MFYKNIGILLVAVFLVLGIFVFCPLSLTRKTVYVDINSGRLRERIWVGFFICKEKIRETIISQNVVGHTELEPNWRGVSTEPILSYPRFIPWHRIYITAKYAKVPVQLHILGLLWKRNNMTDEGKQRLAADIVSLWKKTGRDDEATLFLTRMFDGCIEGQEPSVIKNSTETNKNEAIGK